MNVHVCIGNGFVGRGNQTCGATRAMVQGRKHGNAMRTFHDGKRSVLRAAYNSEERVSGRIRANVNNGGGWNERV